MPLLLLPLLLLLLLLLRRRRRHPRPGLGPRSPTADGAPSRRGAKSVTWGDARMLTVACARHASWRGTAAPIRGVGVVCSSSAPRCRHPPVTVVTVTRGCGRRERGHGGLVLCEWMQGSVAVSQTQTQTQT